MNIVIKKKTLDKSEPIKIFDIGLILTTFQDLLDNTSIIIEENQIVVLKTNTDFYILPLNYKNVSIYGFGNDIKEESLIKIISEDYVDVLQTNGSIISFNSPKIYGTFTTPETGNITQNLTNAKVGIEQKIYSQKSVEPTYPSGWVKIPSSNSYVVDAKNLIFAEWCEDGRVEYYIINL